MVLDIRARVESNLGPVISASVSDDYIQGNGLIKTSGSCIVKGLISPPVGTPVIFYYTKGGITRRIPRALRVLSSFADPFRKTTSVQLGCKLTYLQDLKDPIDWSAFDDPENGGFTEEDTEIVIVPIRAQAVAEKCLQELGVTASGLSLSNLFSIESFDLSGGYVQVLSDLLVSECYCGWLDQEETLKIINLSTAGGSGPLVQESDIIDVSEIGVGQIPGDAVVVTYSSLKLRLPEGEEITEEDTQDLFDGWEYEESSQTGPGAIITYKNKYAVDAETEEAPAPLLFATYSNYSFSQTSTEYQLIYVLKDNLEWEYNIFGGVDIITPDGRGRSAKLSFLAGNRISPESDYEERSVVKQRVTVEGRPFVEVAGGWVTDALSIGLSPNNYTVTTETTETYNYDPAGNEVLRTLRKTGPALFLMGAAGISYTYDAYVDGEFIGYGITDLPSGTIDLEYTEVETVYASDHTKTVTKRWGPWHETISGQQSISAINELLTNSSQYEDDAESFLSQVVYSGLSLLDVSINTSRSRPQRQSRPGDQEILKSGLAEYSTESQSEVELVTGNPGAQLRIEFSLPYAPDDTFFIVSSGPPTVYGSQASDAPQKAKQFGIVQNKLLLGNRSGMNVQTVPEKLPLEPFSPFFVSANNTISLYRTNATSWTIDNNGIIVSTDALYWGIAGKAT